MVLLWSSLIFDAFAMFSLLFQAFANHCATIGKSMKSNFSMGGYTPRGCTPPIEKLLFIDFPMVARWFPLFFQWFVMVLLLFKWFCNSFHDHPIIFAMVLLLFHWFCNVFTPLSMVCNGFHCFLNGFIVVFRDFQ